MAVFEDGSWSMELKGVKLGKGKDDCSPSENFCDLLLRGYVRSADKLALGLDSLDMPSWISSFEARAFSAGFILTMTSGSQEASSSFVLHHRRCTLMKMKGFPSTVDTEKGSATEYELELTFRTSAPVGPHAYAFLHDHLGRTVDVELLSHRSVERQLKDHMELFGTTSLMIAGPDGQYSIEDRVDKIADHVVDCIEPDETVARAFLRLFPAVRMAAHPVEQC